MLEPPARSDQESRGRSLSSRSRPTLPRLDTRPCPDQEIPLRVLIDKALDHPGLRPVAARGTSPPSGRAGLSSALHQRASDRGPLPAAVEATPRLTYQRSSAGGRGFRARGASVGGCPTCSEAADAEQVSADVSGAAGSRLSRSLRRGDRLAPEGQHGRSTVSVIRGTGALAPGLSAETDRRRGRACRRPSLRSRMRRNADGG